MTMQRRKLFRSVLWSATALLPTFGWAQDKWGAYLGYPTSLSGGLDRDPVYRVGNYSGGFERLIPHRVIKSSLSPIHFKGEDRKDFNYRWGFIGKNATDYMAQGNSTGLLICRGQEILVEKYAHARNESMRFTSWSMAKSITSLLLGVCLDKKLIDSYDDVASKYVPELKDTLHGSTTLRNLSNMSSGAEIVHDRDNGKIYTTAYRGRNSSIFNTIKDWNQRQEDQGTRFNYNELCPLTLGIVIRRATGLSLSEFAQETLWGPIGAEMEASWSIDSERNEFNCVGFAAGLRDWARLGNLVANRGKVDNSQIISAAWINECTTWGPLDKQVRYGVARPRQGYKAHMWHWKADGTRPYFNGHHGQRVIVDLPTKTVLVHTAIDQHSDMDRELQDMLDAASKLQV